MIKKAILGVDIGGVITDKFKNDGTDTSFLGDNYLNTSAVPESFKSLGRLYKEIFLGSVYVVSKCSPKVEHKSRMWMKHHDFYRKTGIPEENVFYCLRRQDKAPICLRLGITHFVDDNMGVLKYLDAVPNLYLFGAQKKEPRGPRGLLDRITRVENWQEAITALSR